MLNILLSAQTVDLLPAVIYCKVKHFIWGFYLRDVWGDRWSVINWTTKKSHSIHGSQFYTFWMLKVFIAAFGRESFLVSHFKRPVWNFSPAVWTSTALTQWWKVTNDIYSSTVLKYSFKKLALNLSIFIFCSFILQLENIVLFLHYFHYNYLP